MTAKSMQLLRGNSRKRYTIHSEDHSVAFKPFSPKKPKKFDTMKSISAICLIFCVAFYIRSVQAEAKFDCLKVDFEKLQKLSIRF